MIVVGRNAVMELLKSGSSIEKILASKKGGDAVFENIISIAKQKKVKLQFVEPDVLNRATSQKHQGILAYTTDFSYCTVEDILEVAKQKNEPNFILILDGIEDPHNLGSIIRVCDCMGVHGIIIGKNRCCSVTDTVLKTSAGAAIHTRIAKVVNINTEIEKLKKLNIWVYACELGGDNLRKFKFGGNTAIVIGSEGKGVSKLTGELCDGRVTIPMFGNVNSLNASVATGMVLYEVKMQLQS